MSRTLLAGMGNWQWLLDVVVAALLAATLLRAYRLDRALAALRDDRGALAALLAEFEDGTKRAQDGLAAQLEQADAASRRTEQQRAAASALGDEMAMLVQRGEQTAERLDHLLRAARSLAPERKQDAAPVSYTDFPDARGTARDLSAAPDRVRSKAERDLMLALQAAR